MAFRGSKSGGENNQSHDDEKHGVGAPEGKEVAAKLAKQKEDAEGDHDGRTHKAADGAALASASSAIAHVELTALSRLLYR